MAGVLPLLQNRISFKNRRIKYLHSSKRSQRFSRKWIFRHLDLMTSDHLVRIVLQRRLMRPLDRCRRRYRRRRRRRRRRCHSNHSLGDEVKRTLFKRTTARSKKPTLLSNFLAMLNCGEAGSVAEWPKASIKW